MAGDQLLEEEVNKPDAGGALSLFINVKVSVQEEGEEDMFFRIKRTTPLKKLMNAFCEKKGVQYLSYVFLSNGTRIKLEKTPEELQMEDGEEIDAFLTQIGAGSQADK